MRVKHNSCRLIFLAAMVFGASLGLWPAGSDPATLQAEPPPRPTPKELLEKEPFQFAALEPSERPRLERLIEPKRFAALKAARDVSLFAARGERESFGAVVMGLGGHALTAKVTELAGPRGCSHPCLGGSLALGGRRHRGRRRRAGPFTGGAAVSTSARNRTHPLGDHPRPPHEDPRRDLPRHASSPNRRDARPPCPSRWRSSTSPCRTSSLQSSFWLFRHTIRNYYGMKVGPLRAVPEVPRPLPGGPPVARRRGGVHDQPLVQMVRDEKGELQVDSTECDRYLDYCMDRGMTAFNVGDLHWFGSYFRSFPVRDLKTRKTETVTLAPDSQQYADTVTRFFRLAREHYTRARLGRPGLPPGLRRARARPETAGRDPALLRAGAGRLARPSDVDHRAPADAHGPSQERRYLVPAVHPLHRSGRRQAPQAGRGSLVVRLLDPHRPVGELLAGSTGGGPPGVVLADLRPPRRRPALLGRQPLAGFRRPDHGAAARRQAVAEPPWGDYGRNGDGYLLYPGPNGPLTSLRFEVMRDGVEDYDALRMLEDLLRQKGDLVPAAVRERRPQDAGRHPGHFRVDDQISRRRRRDGEAASGRQRTDRASVELEGGEVKAGP